jgi:hypothetical protein
MKRQVWCLSWLIVLLVLMLMGGSASAADPSGGAAAIPVPANSIANDEVTRTSVRHQCMKMPARWSPELAEGRHGLNKLRTPCPR